jgi:hypothetical protein
MQLSRRRFSRGSRGRCAFSLIALLAIGLAAGCGVQPSPSANTHADPELEARFPTFIHGGPFLVESYGEPEELQLLGVDDDFLNSLHVDVGDVSVAYGEHDMSSGAPMHLSVRAYRARGASAEDLVAYFRPIMQEQSEGIPLQRTRARGKVVWRPKGNPIAVAGNMLFVNDDTAYLIYGDNRTAALALLSQIPPASS